MKREWWEYIPAVLIILGGFAFFIAIIATIAAVISVAVPR